MQPSDLRRRAAWLNGLANRMPRSEVAAALRRRAAKLAAKAAVVDGLTYAPASAPPRSRPGLIRTVWA
jgi:hypothetical protein